MSVKVSGNAKGNADIRSRQFRPNREDISQGGTKKEERVDCPLRLIYFDTSLYEINHTRRARLSGTNSRERIIRKPQIFTKWNMYMMLQDAVIVIAKLQGKGIQMTMFYG